MRTAIKSLWSNFLLLTLVCVSLVQFTACSDNDEPVEEVTYSWGFADLSASSSDFMDDINKIESTFKTALGVTGSATSVTRQGTSETCDKAVLEACQQALESLKGNVWQGRYTFTVTNVTTGTVIFFYTFDADDNNSAKNYTASDLKIGDYFYSDGTWSDGGLRRMDVDGTLQCADPMPLPERDKTVVGIVFYARHHPTDKSDYSKTGIGQRKCHGYVVALTNVHNERRDRLDWLYDLYGRAVGASTTISDWQGYYNNQKIHEFVDDKANKSGLEMIHFQAAFACETYGNRTVDRKGKPTNAYDWQHPLSAPTNTSGWFLPSCGQLHFLYQNSSLLSARMDAVKNCTPADCSYKDYIKWFSSDYYWSSTEDSSAQENAWSVHFINSYTGNDNKRYGYEVRAVLAF